MLRPGSLPAIARPHRVACRQRPALERAQPRARRIGPGLRGTPPRRVAGVLRSATAPDGRGSDRSRDGSTVPGALDLASTVVIPSRTGKELLQAQLPGTRSRQAPAQIVVVDNGSTDDTAAWLASTYPQIEVVHSAAPLSFARAVNRGIARARCWHVCLLNNDMLLEPGFFAALERAFQQVPDLFCATAQIQFPAGVRREETGKTVFAQSAPTDFPVRCDEPLPGEDGSYVLYGSGGCSLYDTAKLRALGNVDEVYEPAYVEDLDLGYRAWQRGWPSVYVAGAVVEHRHRATTTRYYTEDQLAHILEINYLRFVARAVSDSRVFRRLWAQAHPPLVPAARARSTAPPAIALRGGPRAPGRLLRGPLPRPHRRQRQLSSRAVPPTDKPRVLVASPYLPFPLSHGGAVRMYNLMRRAAEEFDLVLVAFTEHAAPPPPSCSRSAPKWCWCAAPAATPCPSPAVPKWSKSSLRYRSAPHCSRPSASGSPAVAQLEFTQLAQYAADCAPARTILVEHDVTFDLYEQLLAHRRPTGSCAASSSSGASSKPPPGGPWIASSP